MTSRDVCYCAHCHEIAEGDHCTAGHETWRVCVRDCPTVLSLGQLADRAREVVRGFQSDVARARGVK